MWGPVSSRLQNTSLDVLLLIDEFKTRFEKIGEIAKEIAKKDGRNIVNYEDAEEALKQIRIKLFILCEIEYLKNKVKYVLYNHKLKENTVIFGKKGYKLLIYL